MKGKSVLVVDDDPRILELMASLFENEGLDVRCATSGKEALCLLERKSFSFVVTDLHIPDLNGLDLAVRGREMYPEILMFMITGDVSVEVRNHAREAGIAKVFEKPLRFRDIMETARGFLREKDSVVAMDEKKCAADSL